MVGEMLVGIQLREVPARRVAVDPVVVCRVVAHLLGQRTQEVADTLLLLHRHIEVADQDQRPLRADALLAPAELARRHVPLHDVDAVLLVEGDAGDFVETHHIVLADQAALPVCHVDEHLRDGGLAAREQVRMRGELLVDMTLPRPAGTEFDEVVVALDEGDQPEQRDPLGPFVQRGGFQAGRTEEEVHPARPYRSWHRPLARTFRTDGLDIWMGRIAAMLNGRPCFSCAITGSYSRVTSA